MLLCGATILGHKNDNKQFGICPISHSCNVKIMFLVFTLLNVLVFVSKLRRNRIRNRHKTAAITAHAQQHLWAVDLIIIRRSLILTCKLVVW